MIHKPSGAVPWLLVLGLLAAGTNVGAHCQVPCGIYDDEARVNALREDARTIAKAVDQIATLASAGDAQSLNQLTRWVMTKEAHAAHVIEVVAEYFLAQRVKPGDDAAAYRASLVDHHAVIVAAMKTKQSADPTAAQALFEAIDGLARHYHEH